MEVLKMEDRFAFNALTYPLDFFLVPCLDPFLSRHFESFALFPVILLFPSLLSTKALPDSFCSVRMSHCQRNDSLSKFYMTFKTRVRYFLYVSNPPASTRMLRQDGQLYLEPRSYSGPSSWQDIAVADPGFSSGSAGAMDQEYYRNFPAKWIFKKINISYFRSYNYLLSWHRYPPYQNKKEDISG